jgi:hypothetical protein
MEAIMSEAVLLASLLVLTGCTTSVVPLSEAKPIAINQFSTPSASASEQPEQGRIEVPHGNTKMDGPRHQAGHAAETMEMIERAVAGKARWWKASLR